MADRELFSSTRGRSAEIKIVSDRDPLHLVERDFVADQMVELGLCAGMLLRLRVSNVRGAPWRESSSIEASWITWIDSFCCTLAIAG